ncbi:hypothetical protein KW797_00510 [Candidatus Parcubacteria bacterium]|nr:hypothetical protein [Candidatus Parcubacteria bacterium]
MDKVYHEKIDVFYGGMPDDIRIQSPEYSYMLQNFDALTNPKRLTPYRAMEADEDTSFKIFLFLYYNSTFFGLGKKSATAIAKIYSKALDPLTGSWGALANGEDAAGTVFAKCFLEFHGYGYGGSASSRIFACDLSGVAAFTSSAYSTAAEPLCQGIKTIDDLLIIPCASGIAKKDGAGSGPTSNWSTFSLIPSSHTPTDVIEFENLAAIAVRPVDGSTGNCMVALWDKVNQDVAKWIDFGEGDNIIISEMEGRIVGVVTVGATSGVSIRAKVVVREWVGGTEASVVREIEADDNTLSLYGNHVKARDGNRLVFGLKIKLDGTTYNQLFAIGRKSAEYPLAFMGDRLVDNDTALTGNINGLYKIGNYFFVAHNSDGSVNRTMDGTSGIYTGVTPLIITAKINGERKVQGAGRMTKQLLAAGLTVAPLTTGQSASLYYRVDSASAWTLIRTYTYGDDAAAAPALTPANMGFEAGMDASGTDFSNYKEMQFKGVSGAGAEITGIFWSWKLMGSLSST